MRYFSTIALSLFFPSQLTIAAQEATQDWMPAQSFTKGVEGPAVDKNGNLYAVNFAKDGTIGKVNKQNNGEIFIELPNGSIGNGIRFDKFNNMYIADYVNHNIFKYDIAAKQLSVFAHNPKMNQPNDIAISDSGILFASDPNWSKNTGNIWRINTDGTSNLLEANMGTTNGIEVSPDNNTLYVNESVQRKIWRYQLDAQGNISNKSLFYQFDSFGLDGMRCDKAGNLYVARYGAGEVVVISPQGKLLRSIKLKGQHPTNVAFGGKTGKQVFVTMQQRGAIETFQTGIAGRYF
ncbi:gluconolactonase [Thalassotalea insulae]|uniref:Gluconolactonase n=1 Tax=Thalassotalea insulae TaxID=2056778 RepID=A0ABQ6GS41_9GAMM|nr:SMP-30/gluconolactonase/LRE family protein [Thalassotalea insulae]GLX77994.1 gluconolactonase [Thalassotalea insulae]